jgi:hypothetical protein
VIVIVARYLQTRGTALWRTAGSGRLLTRQAKVADQTQDADKDEERQKTLPVPKPASFGC